MTERELAKLRAEMYQLIEGEPYYNQHLVFSPEISFAQLLESFVHLEFTEEDAIEHCKMIAANAQDLKNALGRDIGIHLALVDYFTNINHIMTSPMLIEIHVFKQTEQLAMIDSLTETFNRRYMDLILKKEFFRCSRHNKELSVCILDIDDFKKINDTRGHQFGDIVLKELSLIMKNCVREEDIVCRYGGEEFLIILPETGSDGVTSLASRIQKTSSESPVFDKNHITFSAGTATFPGCALDIENLIKAADQALYKAKLEGKNTIISAESMKK
ncbi:GGDEF domain-containing protein [Brucepastera parasyntrophica]|uniref:GGDEF domain-containing protein n=1 Tax=Brucepastera parasyntrophica TaxID=2880008 RepID=UPI00210928BE|nr:GGDEF domain-containing protein [Brucepastera parasyntrophica]ULQ59147.1 GGDEF domain-containing protein [Brucepastera parasyntrophica]